MHFCPNANSKGRFARSALIPLAQRLIENASPPRMVFRVETKATRTLSFEDALAQLESIVESMESGQVPLAELLAKFEDGNKLLKICEARLKDAELRIEQLAKQKDVLTAFAATETPREA